MEGKYKLYDSSENYDEFMEELGEFLEKLSFYKSCLCLEAKILFKSPITCLFTDSHRHNIFSNNYNGHFKLGTLDLHIVKAFRIIFKVI